MALRTPRGEDDAALRRAETASMKRRVIDSGARHRVTTLCIKIEAELSRHSHREVSPCPAYIAAISDRRPAFAAYSLPFSETGDDFGVVAAMSVWRRGSRKLDLPEQWNIFGGRASGAPTKRRITAPP